MVARNSAHLGSFLRTMICCRRKRRVRPSANLHARTAQPFGLERSIDAASVASRVPVTRWRFGSRNLRRIAGRRDTPNVHASQPSEPNGGPLATRRLRAASPTGAGVPPPKDESSTHLAGPMPGAARHKPGEMSVSGALCVAIAGPWTDRAATQLDERIHLEACAAPGSIGPDVGAAALSAEC